MNGLKQQSSRGTGAPGSQFRFTRMRSWSHRPQAFFQLTFPHVRQAFSDVGSSRAFFSWHGFREALRLR